MGKITRFSMIIAFLGLVLWLAACERTLYGNERAAVLEFSEPMVDDLFAGLAANDYALFSRHFHADMLERVPRAAFSTWQQQVDNELGTYLSRAAGQVTRSDGEFDVVVYAARFEKAEEVTVTVAFTRTDHLLHFLAFEADEYSWSAWE